MYALPTGKPQGGGQLITPHSSGLITNPASVDTFGGIILMGEGYQELCRIRLTHPCVGMQNR